MDKLKSIRQTITDLDAQIYPLFAQRMRATDEVARIKRENNLPILDESRELEVARRAQELAGSPYEGEAAALARCIMTLSRSRQRKLLHGKSLPMPDFAVPAEVRTVAFQGVPGAFSQEAAAKLHPQATLCACDAFEDVFTTVLAGQADIGVVPIENSLSGAISEVYELLRRHGCYIAGEVILPIKQCLLGVPGAKEEDIRTVTSHPEALKQCRGAIRAAGWQSIAAANTAMAAKAVAQGGDISVAAIGSRRAAELYGLVVLREGIQANDKNRTRFIALSARPVAPAQANRIAATFVTGHHAGALSDVLLAVSSAGVNLSRILSQPDGNGGYRFFIDMEGDYEQQKVRDMLSQASNACQYFEVLGVYRANG